MNTSNLPKRFGLKYSPKPLIALEYEINGPDPESRILEVYLEQLSPSKYDVDGVLHALQQTYPRHLGAYVVSAAQLESLVARLLEHGKPDLPEEYQSRADETLVKGAHKTSPDRFLLAKPSIQGDRISYDHILGDSGHPFKELTPTSTPKAEHGGLSDDEGALQRLDNNLTREDNVGVENCGVGTSVRYDRPSEVRALSRREDGVKEKAGIVESKEESEGKGDDKGTADGIPKANQTPVDINRQSEANAESREGERLHMACFKNCADSPSIMVTGSSATGLQFNGNYSKDESRSEVEEDIPEEVYGKFDDFEEGGYFGETTHNLEASDAAAPNVSDESDYVNDAASAVAVTRTNSNVTSENETEETPRSGVDNTAGDQEQPKIDDEARDTDTTKGRGPLDTETVTLDPRLQRSDVSLAPPAPPPRPHRASLKATPSDRCESPVAPSSFGWSGRSSKQPSSSTGDLITQPLLGTPLPPLLGAQQRFVLLGSLPPAGRRGLPSLDEAVAASGKPRNADMSERAVSSISSRRVGSGVAVSAHDSDRLMISSTRQHPENSAHEANGASVARVTNELASGNLTVRTRLGLSDEDTPEDEKVGVITTLESPKQHQGHDEEADGRRLESEVDGGSESIIGGGGGGRRVADYFADLDAEGEIREDLLGDGSSIDDSISFERESVNDADRDFFS